MYIHVKGSVTCRNCIICAVESMGGWQQKRPRQRAGLRDITRALRYRNSGKLKMKVALPVQSVNILNISFFCIFSRFPCG